MSNKTLEILNRIDGTLTDYDDLPVLSDAAGTYGVRVVSGGALVPDTLGAAFTKLDTGSYAITITGLTAGVEYQYAITRVYRSASRTTEETFTIPVATPGDYATEDDMSERWGDALLKKVSQRNPSINAIDWDVVTRSLVAARGTINTGLGASRYAVPLTSMDAETAELLKDMCTRQALVWLYETRLGQDLDAEGRPTHPAKQHAEFVALKLRNIRAGFLPIVAAKRYTGPTGITVARSR
jgi:phage gp36-like protein